MMIDQNELPLGFTYALARNPEAMKTFSNLPKEGRWMFAQRAHAAKTKEEMQALILELTTTE